MMSASKNKQNMAEVASARNRFDAALQLLVDKRDDGQESSDEGGEIDICLSEPSPVHSPSKRSSTNRGRKRKRAKDDSDYEMGQYQHTYIMKLFDRSVDLAIFDEDSSLYPICRAWLKNSPHSRDPPPQSPEPEAPAPTNSEEETERIPDIYKMPPPIKQDPDDHTDYRIPHPVPQPKTYFFISDADDAPPAESLLLKHMERWKQVRQSWIDQGRINEMRYGESMQLLRDIFDCQMKDV